MVRARGRESFTLLAQLEAWFADMGVLHRAAASGYGSQTYIDDVADLARRDGRQAVLIYAGDFDPSGEDILRDFTERCDAWEEVEHIAVRPEQIDELGLPVNPGKVTDSRAAAFTERHGELVQVEVEAIEPDVLRQLYADALEGYWDTRPSSTPCSNARGRARARLAALASGYEDEPASDENTLGDLLWPHRRPRGAATPWRATRQRPRSARSPPSPTMTPRRHRHLPLSKAFRDKLEGLRDVDGRTRRRTEAHIMSLLAGALTQAQAMGVEENDASLGGDMDFSHAFYFAEALSGSDEEAAAYVEWLDQRTGRMMRHPGTGPRSTPWPTSLHAWQDPGRAEARPTKSSQALGPAPRPRMAP